ncbi:MAG: VOC family protein [Acidimicrobiia bacterium]|nr:VOC family protein [Acidimicrobiia bacterium]
MRVTGMDHVVLCVADTARSVAWYRDRLGLAPERFDEWQRGEVLFTSLRIDEHTIIDLLETEPTGVNVDHLCLVVDDFDPEAEAASGRWDVHGGPAEVWGAQGMGVSLYVRDPDGHIVELRSYPS